MANLTFTIVEQSDTRTECRSVFRDVLENPVSIWSATPTEQMKPVSRADANQVEVSTFDAVSIRTHCGCAGMILPCPFRCRKYRLPEMTLRVEAQAASRPAPCLEHTDHGRGSTRIPWFVPTVVGIVGCIYIQQVIS